MTESAKHPSDSIAAIGCTIRMYDTECLVSSDNEKLALVGAISWSV
jgi:hypothetical protein